MRQATALSVAKPSILAKIHSQTIVPRQGALQIGSLRYVQHIKSIVIAQARSRKKDEEDIPLSYEQALLQREQQLWDRQSQLLDAAAKEAKTNYDTLMQAYTQLQAQLSAERQAWAEQEEALRKENAELRAQLLYTAAQIATLGGKSSHTSSQEEVLDGRAAAAELPSPSDPATPGARSPPSTTKTSAGVPSWAAELEAAMEAVDHMDILTEDVDYAALARAKQAQPDATEAPPSVAAAAPVHVPAAPIPATANETLITESPTSPTELEEEVPESLPIPEGPPPVLSQGADDIFWMNQLHTALVDAGYYPGDDDIDDYYFGEGTLSALMTMQACEGINETGTVDEEMWKMLLGPELKLKESRDLAEDQFPPDLFGKFAQAAEAEASSENVNEKPYAELFAALTEQTTVVSPGGKIEGTSSRTVISDTEIFRDGHVEEDVVSIEQVATPAAGGGFAVETSTSSVHIETVPKKWPTLMEGDGNKEVHALHVLLEAEGFGIDEDETRWWQFGMGTQNSLKTFQACSGLAESGICDANTWKKLLGADATPADIYKVQSGGSDDEDLSTTGVDRVWLMAEQRWEDRSKLRKK